VLLCIADEADDEGRNAFPSIERIAAKANCHKDTVLECIKRLEGIGELEVLRPSTPGRGRFNRYRVLVGKYGNSDHSSPGSIEGSVEGYVRTDPTQNDEQSDLLTAPVRPFREKPRAYPQDGLGRMPEPRPWCDVCEGTGRARNEAGEFTFEACPDCAA